MFVVWKQASWLCQRAAQCNKRATRLACSVEKEGRGIAGNGRAGEESTREGGRATEGGLNEASNLEY